MNVCDFLPNNAANRPNAVAMEDGERAISYRELDELVRRTAVHLRSLNVGIGTHVGLCLKDTADHFVVMLAVWRLGAVSVTLDWRAPIRENDRFGSMFDVEIVVTEPNIDAASDTRSVAMDNAWHQAVTALEPRDDFPHDGSLPMMIATTSGTTGEVKGIPVTHDQAFARFVSSWLAFGWLQGDRYLSSFSMHYIVGRAYPLFHMIAGNTVILFPTLFSAWEYVESINRTGATVGCVVPTVLRWILDLPASHKPLLPGVRMLAVAGALSHEEEKRTACERITPAIADVYGNTGIGDIALMKPEELAAKAHTVGQPTPMVEVQIVDAEDRPLGAGESGILRCRGPGMSTGFYGTQVGQDDAETFRDGWFYPGDLARLDEDGYLSITGRASDLIIRGGVNISSGEIEAVLLSHPAVVEAAVVGWPSPEYGEELAAFVVVKVAVSTKTIGLHCRDRLASYKIPREIFFRDALPKGRSGKIRKVELAHELPPLSRT